MIEPTQEELEQEFESLNDEELLARCESGILTKNAKSIAFDEAHRRGLNPVERQPVVEEDETYYGDYVIVVPDLNMAEADLYKMLLEAAGVPAEVGDTNFSRAYGTMYAAYVKVPEAFVDQAREIFAAFRRGDFAIGDDFEPDDK